MKLTKTEKLILMLCRECIGKNNLNCRIGDIDVDVCQFDNNQKIIKTWTICFFKENINDNLITAIKEIRAIKRGEK